MSKRVRGLDLTGVAFGRLIAVARSREPGRARWECRCACGTLRVYRQDHLLRAESTSCGCASHEKASQRVGVANPNFGKRIDPNMRFDGRVEPITEAGCHIWMGALSENGYGMFWVDPGRGLVGAHVYAYEREHGHAPQGLDLDHLCRTRCCVNPQHLEPVTRGENIRRGYRHRRAEVAWA